VYPSKHHLVAREDSSRPPGPPFRLHALHIKQLLTRSPIGGLPGRSRGSAEDPRGVAESSPTRPRWIPYRFVFVKARPPGVPSHASPKPLPGTREPLTARNTFKEWGVITRRSCARQFQDPLHLRPRPAAPSARCLIDRPQRLPPGLEPPPAAPTVRCQRPAAKREAEIPPTIETAAAAITVRLPRAFQRDLRDSGRPRAPSNHFGLFNARPPLAPPVGNPMSQDTPRDPSSTAGFQFRVIAPPHPARRARGSPGRRSRLAPGE